MWLVLRPAALLLPRRWAMAVADTLALPLLVLPNPGADVYREMRRAFGRGRRESLRLAWGWVARPFRDYTALRRLANGRQKLDVLEVTEKNIEGIRGLRESGESYLVVTIHGAREAYAATRHPAITPGHIVQVGLSPPRRIRSLYDLRIRIQYGALVRTLTEIRADDLEFVAIDVDPLPAWTLLKKLRTPGNVVMMDLDAARRPLETGTFERNFAGEANRHFSTGAAQLAAMARCPIIPCACSVEEDGSLLVEWGEPMREVDDAEGAMNRLLDYLEPFVAERPTQYVRRLAGQRRWNAQARRWEEGTG